MTTFCSKESISVIVGVPACAAIGWFLDPIAGLIGAAAVFLFFLFVHRSTVAKLSAIANDVRSGLDDRSLMEKYLLSKAKLDDLLVKLVKKDYLKRAEVGTAIRHFRKISKEKTFLSDDSDRKISALTGISPYAFMHPLDAYATRTLRMIAVLDVLVAKMLEFGYDKILRTIVKDRCVRASPSDFGYLHDMTRHAADRLDLEVLPELYLSDDPSPNAWTSGHKRPFIVIHGGLLELMNDEEIHSVIAHEAGHIKSHHVLYHSLAMFLKEGSHAIHLTGLVLDYSFWLAFMSWMRASELSADRAALVVTGKKDVVGMFEKLGTTYGESIEMMPETSSEKSNFPDWLTKILRFRNVWEILNNLTSTHPMLSKRLEEVEKWSQSVRYQGIMNGQYVKVSDKQLQVITGGRSLPTAAKKGSVIIKNRIITMAELLPEYGDTLREWMTSPHDHVEGALGKIEKVADQIGDYLKKGSTPATDKEGGYVVSRAEEDWAKFQAGLKKGTTKARDLLKAVGKKSSSSK